MASSYMRQPLNHKTIDICPETISLTQVLKNKPLLASFYISNLCHKCILHFFSAALPFFHLGSCALMKAQRLSIMCNLNGHSLPTKRAMCEKVLGCHSNKRLFPSHLRLGWVGLLRQKPDAFQSKHTGGKGKKYWQ